jgi:hypothetical protein
MFSIKTGQDELTERGDGPREILDLTGQPASQPWAEVRYDILPC